MLNITYYRGSEKERKNDPLEILLNVLFFLFFRSRILLNVLFF